MTAEEIRKLKPSTGNNDATFLQEIAAQLADLNQHLSEQAEVGKKALAQINEAVESMRETVNQL